MTRGMWEHAFRAYASRAECDASKRIARIKSVNQMSRWLRRRASAVHVAKKVSFPPRQLYI